MKVNIVINMVETTSFMHLGNFSLMVEIEVAIRHHSPSAWSSHQRTEIDIL